MSAMRRVIGVDPGPTPGVVVLDVKEGRLSGAEVVQCSHGFLLEVLAALNAQGSVVAVERFVTRGRANAAQQLTRDQVAVLSQILPHAVQRSAAAVKPWASNERLARAGLLELTEGMRHARDGARHALFAAVREAGLVDPLSKEFTR